MTGRFIMTKYIKSLVSIMFILFSINASASLQTCYCIKEIPEYVGKICLYQCKDGSLIEKQGYNFPCAPKITEFTNDDYLD